jgi:hypothetical protein
MFRWDCRMSTAHPVISNGYLTSRSKRLTAMPHVWPGVGWDNRWKSCRDMCQCAPPLICCKRLMRWSCSRALVCWHGRVQEVSAVDRTFCFCMAVSLTTHSSIAATSPLELPLPPASLDPASPLERFSCRSSAADTWSLDMSPTVSCSLQVQMLTPRKISQAQQQRSCACRQALLLSGNCGVQGTKSTANLDRSASAALMTSSWRRPVAWRWQGRSDRKGCRANVPLLMRATAPSVTRAVAIGAIRNPVGWVRFSKLPRRSWDVGHSLPCSVRMPCTPWTISDRWSTCSLRPRQT